MASHQTEEERALGRSNLRDVHEVCSDRKRPLGEIPGWRAKSTIAVKPDREQKKGLVAPAGANGQVEMAWRWLGDGLEMAWRWLRTNGEIRVFDVFAAVQLRQSHA
jgi:hypothetical protein